MKLNISNKNANFFFFFEILQYYKSGIFIDLKNNLEKLFIIINLNAFFQTMNNFSFRPRKYRSKSPIYKNDEIYEKNLYS